MFNYLPIVGRGFSSFLRGNDDSNYSVHIVNQVIDKIDRARQTSSFTLAVMGSRKSYNSLGCSSIFELDISLAYRETTSFSIQKACYARAELVVRKRLLDLWVLLWRVLRVRSLLLFSLQNHYWNCWSCAKANRGAQFELNSLVLRELCKKRIETRLMIS
ncbi:hypothetical protein SAMN06265350_106197 [Solitalea koreensis]|uniref:Uncharacterized protein n=1 Tax=Solitalea koreensis TaxID=543615 RepID=A0A521DCV0_9SPHI|nr:hypothetical protein SAMN06265350_106197 [Solitalea koreensis]